MTPKDKAIELYNKYEQLGRDFTRGVSMKEFAKQCALIAVDEMIEVAKSLTMETQEWYEEVKKEIEAL